MDNPMIPHIVLFPVSCVLGLVLSLIHYRQQEKKDWVVIWGIVLLFPFGYFGLQILLLFPAVPLSKYFESEVIIGASMFMTAIFAWPFAFGVTVGIKKLSIYIMKTFKKRYAQPSSGSNSTPTSSHNTL